MMDVIDRRERWMERKKMEILIKTEHGSMKH